MASSLDEELERSVAGRMTSGTDPSVLFQKLYDQQKQKHIIQIHYGKRIDCAVLLVQHTRNFHVWYYVNEETGHAHVNLPTACGENESVVMVNDATDPCTDFNEKVLNEEGRYVIENAVLEPPVLSLNAKSRITRVNSDRTDAVVLYQKLYKKQNKKHLNQIHCSVSLDFAVELGRNAKNPIVYLPTACGDNESVIISNDALEPCTDLTTLNEEGRYLIEYAVLKHAELKVDSTSRITKI